MESTLTVILALNRCMDIIWPSMAERLFSVERSWIWIGVAVIYGLCFAFFGKPVLYTAIYMSWFFYAHVGYSHLHEEEYVNTFNLVHNTFVFAAIISLYSLFLIMYTIKMLKYEQHTMPAAKKSWSKKMIFWQVVIISGAHAASAGLYMYMNYFPVSKAVIYFVSYCWMCTHGIPCVIYLTLNKTIRGACLRMIRIKRSDQSTQAVSTIAQKQVEFIRTVYR
ncbi:serpentine type 7TM GPCR chemoreceptor srt domain-containing protein [Ditylenchus destructor]|uniref:Serpentine type 7TM GPCR chemoreceptor srt domain-containing protein n=1 Tax=Ditylenchus destructor TaxID=166010 RepID=A0AAD4N9E1_9BILA|nr:serpentine type 7TM GPCR chemoreceptor srt domain-containing protein [Ditylenchus destructor]